MAGRGHSAILKGRYASALDRILLLSILGLVWDRAEPSGYMGSFRGPRVPHGRSASLTRVRWRVAVVRVRDS